MPILSHISAIDTELTCRGIRMCGCGLATDNAAMMNGHLSEYPGHRNEISAATKSLAGRSPLLEQRDGQPPS